jgi:uncharacterized protein YbbC (DUF1343 family)
MRALVITDRQAYRPVRTSLLLIDEIRRQHPRDFAWTGTIDRLTGSDKVRLAIESGRLPALLEEWDREAAEFRESRKVVLTLLMSRWRLIRRKRASGRAADVLLA